MAAKKSSIKAELKETEKIKEAGIPYEKLNKALKEENATLKEENDKLSFDLSDLEFQLDSIIEDLNDTIATAKEAYDKNLSTPKTILGMMVKKLRIIINKYNESKG